MRDVGRTRGQLENHKPEASHIQNAYDGRVGHIDGPKQRNSGQRWWTKIILKELNSILMRRVPSVNMAPGLVNENYLLLFA